MEDQNELVQLNVRIERWKREALNEDPRKAVNVINDLLDKYYFKTTLEVQTVDSKYTDILEAQLKIKDEQIAELQRSIAKSQDNHELQMHQLQSTIAPMISKEITQQLAEHTAEKKPISFAKQIRDRLGI